MAYKAISNRRSAYGQITGILQFRRHITRMVTDNLILPSPHYKSDDDVSASIGEALDLTLSQVLSAAYERTF